MRYLSIFMMWAVSLMAVAAPNPLSAPDAAQVLHDVFVLDHEAYAQHLPQVRNAALKAYVEEYYALMVYASANHDKNFEQYQRKSSAALKAAEQHQYSNTLLSNIYLHRCMAEMSKGNLLTGGMQFWKAYRAFLRGEDKYADTDGQLMLRGIYNILLAQIPQKWQGLAGFFGFGKGNMALGFEQIDQYRNRVKGMKGLKDEALLVSFANIFLSNDQRISDALASEMCQSRAPIVVYAYVLSLGRQQKGDEAHQLVNNLSAQMLKAFPLLKHQQAKVALRGLEFQKCITLADEFYNTYSGSACKNDALLLKAYAQLLLGKRQEALFSAKLCADMQPSSDLDKRTQKDAQRLASEDTHLLTSRFCCEYGRFEKAISVLDGFHPSASQQIEYHFRLARAHEKLGHTDEALHLYDKVISLAQKDNRYFGPYSAVYVADIYLSRGDKARARTYIAHARKLNNGEYQKEIDQRISIASRLSEE